MYVHFRNYFSFLISKKDTFHIMCHYKYTVAEVNPCHLERLLLAYGTRFYIDVELKK